MRGCLSLPFRLLSLVVLAGIVYLVWVRKDDVRRWIHEITADGAAAPAPPPAAPIDRGELAARATARIDSVRRGRADSVVVPAAEIEALLAAPVRERAGQAVEDVRIRLEEGEATISATLDASKLPEGSLGPLTEWVTGKQPIEASGRLGLRRLGVGEWQLESVRIRGVPLPRALAVRLAGLITPGADGTVTFPVPEWVTGVHLSPAGAILYGEGRSR